MGFKLGNGWIWKRFEAHIRKTYTTLKEWLVEVQMFRDALESLPRSEVSVYGWLVPLPVGCGKAGTSWHKGVMGEYYSYDRKKRETGRSQGHDSPFKGTLH